jgi:AraC-like DNA-binding protein
MSYRETQPPPEANDLSCAVWHIEEARPSLILPDGCADIICIPAQKRVFAVGVMTHAITSSFDGVALFGVRLQPWAARSVLGVSASSLCQKDALLEDLAPALFSRFRHVDTVSALLQELSSLSTRAALKQSMDERVLLSVKRLQADHQEKVEDLARDLSLSPRQLQRLFLLHVGITPKQFARIIRLQQAKKVAHGHKRLAEISAEAGYADQAHLCREARALTGLAASQLF